MENTAKKQVQETAKEVQQSAKQATQQAKAKAQTLKNQAQAQAQELARDAKQQARQQVKSAVEPRRQAVAEQTETLAKAVRRSGRTLENNQQTAVVADYTYQLADQIEGFSSYLQSSNIEQIMDDAQDLARNNPEIFIGGAFTVGLLAARFLKSSKQRHPIPNRPIENPAHQLEYQPQQVQRAPVRPVYRGTEEG